MAIIIDITLGLRFFRKNNIIIVIKKENKPLKGYIEIPPFTKVRCIFNGGTKYIVDGIPYKFTIGEIYNVDKFIAGTSNVYVNNQRIYLGLSYNNNTDLRQYTGFEPYYENSEMFELW